MTEITSMKNTKKEMLDIIHKLQKEIEEKEKTKLNPEKVKAEAKKIEVVKKADQDVDSEVSTLIHTLKISINKELTSLSDQIEEQAKKYNDLKQAIEIKQTELNEIYGIEKTAADLAVMLEAQNFTREKFDDEIAEKRENMVSEITETKAKWEKEKADYLKELAEEKKKIEKERNRENEEYEYQLIRTRELEENEFADKMAKLEKDIKQKKEDFSQFQQTKTAELNEREVSIAEREKAMDELQDKVASFPVELEKTVDSAIKETEKRLTKDSGKNEELLIKGFEGEKNVFAAKINALESLVKEQAKQIEKLNMQQEKAYEQVQDIASKAVVGAANRPQQITLTPAEGGGSITSAK